MGLSGSMNPSKQAKAFGDAWEKLPAPRPQLSLAIMDTNTGKRTYFNLGLHPPRLWPEEMELLHKLWLDLTSRGLGHKLHHRDVVRVALRKLESALASDEARSIVDELKKETEEHQVKHPGQAEQLTS
jgi:hypothetical protein